MRSAGSRGRGRRGRGHLAVVVVAAVIALTTDARAGDPTQAEMAVVPAGVYVPLYGRRDRPVRVEAFAIDVHPVTNGEFFRFAAAHPPWQRGVVTPLFADPGYLGHWEGALRLGADSPMRAPVTNVSWFAARAYCADRGKRLPTLDEWEYVARASEERPDAAGDPAFDRRILEWYGRPSPLPLQEVGATFENVFGVWDLHGLVWEWVEDFNAVMMTGESRKDGAGLDPQLFCAGGAVGSVDPGDYAAFMRYALRASLRASYTVRNLGFRCARSLGAGGA